MYTQYVHRLSQILQNLQQGRTKQKKKEKTTIIQSNSVTVQLDYTAIIPNDRFEKPVDRDDDVTQEESYVVVCMCEEMCLCGGVNSIGKTKIHLNSSAFNNFISEIRDGQGNAVRRRISS